MSILNISKREKKLVIAAIAALIFFVSFQYIISPQWGKLGQLRSQLQSKQAELSLAENKLKILESMKKQLGVLLKKSQAPKQEKALEVLSILSSVTAKSKLNLESIKPIIDEQDGLKFNLACSGNYQSLYEFIKSLHELKVLVMVDSLNVISQARKSSNLGIQMSLVVYY